MSTRADRWIGFDLRQLEVLVAVADEGSFRAAATRLGYVPSAVSSQIASLERVVGVRLVERTRGPGAISLTPAGRLLREHAMIIVGRVRAAQTDLAALVEGTGPTLRLGITQSVGIRIFPELMHRFRRQWPAVDLVPYEAEGDLELYDLVEAGGLDLTFGELPLPDLALEASEMLRDPYVLLTQHDSALVRPKRRTACLEDFANLPLIGYRTCRGLQRIEAQLRAQMIEPKFVVRSDVNATIQALVGAGVGSAVLPRLAIDERDASTAAIELDPSLGVPPRVLAIVRHRDRVRTPEMDSLITHAREVCASLQARPAEVAAA